MDSEAESSRRSFYSGTDASEPIDRAAMESGVSSWILPPTTANDPAAPSISGGCTTDESISGAGPEEPSITGIDAPGPGDEAPQRFGKGLLGDGCGK